MSVVVTSIAELVTQDPAVGTLRDAAVVCDGGRVAWVGPAATDDELRALLAARVAEMRAQGTTTIEVGDSTASPSPTRCGPCGSRPR